MRGNHTPGETAACPSGSIPADAGEPSTSACSCAALRVYPRGCGGTFLVSRRWRCLAGLSPRMRGNRIRRSALFCDLGSIPADAGEPIRFALSPCFLRVYPRGCGGTTAAPYAVNIKRGLSPRMRGNLVRRRHHSSLSGSIPADAGEPSPRATHAVSKWVYPRGCGGTVPLECRTRSLRGLSPRMRGNQPRERRRYRRIGSIPADAGEPIWNSQYALVWRVYPRGCGGTRSRAWRDLVSRGLSPRMRGNHENIFEDGTVTGSIPADAGEPWCRSCPASKHRVYPRGCGGTTVLVRERLL
ncbi:MAG: hypothetical protein HLUCCA12_01930 [Rhodobacteraceae bacterium HLUCCA12]|nr:MAG: hypothetical protein HLUCCA12_01930 [Rhodobacteraceae bacterium HLUCCA12]